MKFFRILVLLTTLSLIGESVSEATVPFADPVDIARGSVKGVSSLDAKDIDGDGLIDIAVIEGGKHASGKAFAWFKAPVDSQGTWERHEFNDAAPLKSFLGSAKLADFDNDGDGLLDIVISPAEAYRGGKDHDLAWYRNPGGDLTGTWKKSVVLAATNNIHTVKLALVNDDDKLDIVTGVAWGKMSVTVFYNSGNGKFATQQTVSRGKGLYSGVVVDIGNDGDMDIIGQDTYASNSRPYLYESLLKNKN
jgi:hypothetical protein